MELDISPAMMEAITLDATSQLCDDIETLKSTIKHLEDAGDRPIEKYMIGAHKSILIKKLKRQNECNIMPKESKESAVGDDLQKPEEDDDEFDRLLKDTKKPYWESQPQGESNNIVKQLAEAMEENFENTLTPSAHAASLAADPSNSAIIDVNREYRTSHAFKVVAGFCDTEAMLIDAMDDSANIRNETVIFGRDWQGIDGNEMAYDLD